MSVLVPVSAVTGVALSVRCGVLVLGDPRLGRHRDYRPRAVVGVAGGGARDGLLAGAGVAVRYVAQLHIAE
ncbi:hypothetical protein N4P33_15020 [Streptomyces sp. 15-116A]|uniref:hypothetical protein n=1 Tax=Streptomyces sp. 15-116A TaxID=2259035 RepID=UPI0021B4CB82|nr:hypothetical protein [Streptomyces sp. 15-116A]MCT7353478.1 hypothetical protein [Streptomyces sp. 15-116A]